MQSSEYDEVARLLTHGTSVFNVGVSMGNIQRHSYSGLFSQLQLGDAVLSGTTVQNMVNSVQNRQGSNPFTRLSVYFRHEVAPNGNVRIHGCAVLISGSGS